MLFQTMFLASLAIVSADPSGATTCSDVKSSYNLNSCCAADAAETPLGLGEYFTDETGVATESCDTMVMVHCTFYVPATGSAAGVEVDVLKNSSQQRKMFGSLVANGRSLFHGTSYSSETWEESGWPKEIYVMEVLPNSAATLDYWVPALMSMFSGDAFYPYHQDFHENYNSSRILFHGLCDEAKNRQKISQLMGMTFAQASAMVNGMQGFPLVQFTSMTGASVARGPRDGLAGKTFTPVDTIVEEKETDWFTTYYDTYTPPTFSPYPIIVVEWDIQGGLMTPGPYLNHTEGASVLSLGAPVTLPAFSISPGATYLDLSVRSGQKVCFEWDAIYNGKLGMHMNGPDGSVVSQHNIKLLPAATTNETAWDACETSIIAPLFDASDASSVFYDLPTTLSSMESGACFTITESMLGVCTTNVAMYGATMAKGVMAGYGIPTEGMSDEMALSMAVTMGHCNYGQKIKITCTDC